MTLVNYVVKVFVRTTYPELFLCGDGDDWDFSDSNNLVLESFMNPIRRQIKV